MRGHPSKIVQVAIFVLIVSLVLIAVCLHYRGGR